MIVGQKGVTVWFTGMSGAGKTALAVRLEEALRQRGLRVERLDGDIVRQGLTSDLGFSKEDRNKNIERVTFVAKLLTRNGVAVLCSFISPYRQARDNARQQTGSFVEVYCYAPLEALIERDVKGLYKKALAGEIENFTGVSDPYEEPLSPEVTINSATETIEDSLTKILAKLEELGHVPTPDQPDGEAYSAEEEAEIEARLAALGYL
jgi:adenylyl-sulfate kinase